MAKRRKRAGAFTGIERAQRNLNREIHGIIERTAAGVSRAGDLVFEDSQRRTPIDEGDLKASEGKLDSEGRQGPFTVIGYSDPKARFVHDRYDQAHEVGEAGFLLKAVDQNARRIVEIIRQEARVR